MDTTAPTSQPVPTPGASVRKAVVPAAGLGTRFRPVTRAVPKPLLPVLDTPALHYVVREAFESGIEQVALIVAPGQEAIARYIKDGPDEARVSTVLQYRQRGTGHAVLQARDFVGEEPFAVLLPDDLFWGSRPALSYLIDVFERFGESVIVVEEVDDERVPSLGIIDPVPLEEGLFEVRSMVEKPRIEDAPSNLACIGRYVLTSDIFDILEGLPPGANDEIQLTDAIAAQLGPHRVYARLVPGVHIDAGTPIGLLRASVHEALRRQDTSAAVRELLKEELTLLDR